MLSNFSQYTPQGLAPQIPGLQGIGAPQLNSGSVQPGLYGNAWSGHELGQQAPTWTGQINPFGQNPQGQPTLVANAQIPNAIQMVPVLGQVAQQLAIQCAITQQLAQQLSLTVQHLAQQLAAQGQQGQYYGQNPQYYGQNPYAAAMQQGGYSGFNPQVQAWGGNRQPTIQ